MSRKPRLPGAAEFFALSDTASAAQTSPTQVPEPVASKPPRTPLHAELLPSLTIAQGPTEKVTFYLSPLLLRRLELYRAQLLVEHNLKVNRSQIVDFLLEEGLRDVEPLTDLSLIHI